MKIKLPTLKYALLKIYMLMMCCVKTSRYQSVTKVSNIRNIALWQFGGVGDMILITPVITALSQRFPNADIQVWCSSPTFAQFLLRFKQVKSIHLFKVYDFDARTLLHADMRHRLRSILDDMRFVAPDMLIDLHVPTMLDWWVVKWFLISRLNPRCSLGVNPLFIKGKSILDGSINIQKVEGAHYTKLYQKLLATAGVSCSPDTVFPLMPDDSQKIKKDLAKQGLDIKKPWVCMHIGGRRLKIENKMWPIEYFAELGEKLLDDSVIPVLIGVKSECALGDHLCIMVPSMVNMIGRTTLGEMAALIDLAHGFVGHDSGPFHIAVAVNTPAVAICGRPDAEPEYLKYDKPNVMALMANSPEILSVQLVYATAVKVMQ